MCAIIDNNVRHEVFGDRETQTPAGKYFLDWAEGPRGNLVIGGELRRELNGYARFQLWLRTATRRNIVRSIADEQVESETRKLREQRICKSNDKHVLALARVSGTHLLFTNDQALQDDFKNKNIINNPPGQIYTTARHKDIQKKAHRDPLTSRNIREICRHCLRQK